MPTAEMTLNEIRSRGYAALARELGPIGYVRFVEQFAVGSGDFTTERRAFVDRLTAEQIRQMIQQRRDREVD